MDELANGHMLISTNLQVPYTEIWHGSAVMINRCAYDYTRLAAYVSLTSDSSEEFGVQRPLIMVPWAACGASCVECCLKQRRSCHLSASLASTRDEITCLAAIKLYIYADNESRTSSGLCDLLLSYVFVLYYEAVKSQAPSIVSRVSYYVAKVYDFLNRHLEGRSHYDAWTEPFLWCSIITIYNVNDMMVVATCIWQSVTRESCGWETILFLEMEREKLNWGQKGPPWNLEAWNVRRWWVLARQVSCQMLHLGSKKTAVKSGC